MFVFDFELFLTLLGVLLTLEAWRSHVVLARPLDTTHPVRPLKHYPSVSVIRPVKGLDTEAQENIRSALTIPYRGAVETVFVFDHRDEPAFALLKEETARLVAGGAAPDVKAIFCGEPPVGRTGKLNAMIEGLREAKGEVIAFVDSDVRPRAGALGRMIGALSADPKVGAVFGQVIVTERPRTVGDAGYAILLNALYAPAALWAAERAGWLLPFIMGQVMVFRREAIEAIGGLESASGQLVDDMYLGQLLNRAGYRNLLLPERIPIVHYGLDLHGFWKLFVRWITFSRQGIPDTAFKWISWRRGLTYWLGLIGAGAAAWVGSLPATIACALAPLTLSASLNLLHLRAGGAPLGLGRVWVSFAVVLAAPVVYASVLLERKVVWRGRTYELDAKSRLAAEPAPAPAYIERRRVWRYLPPDRERRRAA
jgi:ceramide glucosyltransferase